MNIELARLTPYFGTRRKPKGAAGNDRPTTTLGLARHHRVALAGASFVLGTLGMLGCERLFTSVTGRSAVPVSLQERFLIITQLAV
jgi:hypothetical protein